MPNWDDSQFRAWPVLVASGSRSPWTQAAAQESLVTPGSGTGEKRSRKQAQGIVAVAVVEPFSYAIAVSIVHCRLLFGQPTTSPRNQPKDGRSRRFWQQNHLEHGSFIRYDRYIIGPTSTPQAGRLCCSSRRSSAKLSTIITTSSFNAARPIIKGLSSSLIRCLPRLLRKRA
ncbi:hypothetical protein MY3296_007195 [Beauveria thailandica]